MNIFVLDNDPRLAAIWQHDRHVVKMILESAQMLSTATRHEVLSINPSQYLTAEQIPNLYKSTHVNHPCNIWLRESWANFAWLTIHLDALVGEYHRRFRKQHATDWLKNLFNGVVAQHCGVDRFWTRDPERNLMVSQAIQDLASQHTPFAVCMPEEFKHHTVELSSEGDPWAVESYRNLYRGSKIFQQHVKWTRCESLPQFLLDVQPGDLSYLRVQQLIHAHESQVAAGWDTTPRPINAWPGTGRNALPSTPPIDYASLPKRAKLTRFGAPTK